VNRKKRITTSQAPFYIVTVTVTVTCSTYTLTAAHTNACACITYYQSYYTVKLITVASIDLNSHAGMVVPRPGMESNVGGLDMGKQEVVHWCVSIRISSEYLQENLTAF